MAQKTTLRDAWMCRGFALSEDEFTAMHRRIKTAFETKENVADFVRAAFPELAEIEQAKIVVSLQFWTMR